MTGKSQLTLLLSGAEHECAPAPALSMQYTRRNAQRIPAQAIRPWAAQDAAFRRILKFTEPPDCVAKPVAGLALILVCPYNRNPLRHQRALMDRRKPPEVQVARRKNQKQAKNKSQNSVSFNLIELNFGKKHPAYVRQHKSDASTFRPGYARVRPRRCGWRPWKHAVL